jgi:hypothetical protein
MYENPISLTISTTPALIVGTVTINVLPAPGAAFQYRVVGWDWSLARTVGAAALCDFFLNNNAGNIFMAGGFSLGGRSGDSIILPSPGYSFPLNNRVDFLCASTVAGGVARISLMYYLDPVT